MNRYWKDCQHLSSWTVRQTGSILISALFMWNILPGVLPREFPNHFLIPCRFSSKEIFRQQYPVDEAAWAYLLKSGIDVQREASFVDRGFWERSWRWPGGVYYVLAATSGIPTTRELTYPFPIFSQPLEGTTPLVLPLWSGRGDKYSKRCSFQLRFFVGSFKKGYLGCLVCMQSM